MTAPAASVPASFETIANQADAARSRNRVLDAIRLYREGTHLRPAWTDGWWYLGSLLYDQDRFPEASTAFQRLLATTAHRGPAHAFLGLCNYETGKYDDALAQFRAWGDAGWPGTPQLRDVAVFHFALLLARDGKFVESLYLMAPLAARLGDNPELAEAMGLASLRMRDLPANYPPDRRERIWLAGKAALFAAQSPADFERADEFAARLESRYPAQPEVHFFRAALYGFEGKKEEAEREYRQELRISPNHVPSLVALAAIDLEKAEVAEAGNLARQAAGADPRQAVILAYERMEPIRKTPRRIISSGVSSLRMGICARVRASWKRRNNSHQTARSSDPIWRWSTLDLGECRKRRLRPPPFSH